MQIFPVSHESEETQKSLEEKLSSLPKGTIILSGQAVMAFTNWQIGGSENLVLKIKPIPGSKIRVNPPIEAMYIDLNKDSISFLYKTKGYLIYFE